MGKPIEVACNPVVERSEKSDGSAWHVASCDHAFKTWHYKSERLALEALIDLHFEGERVA